MKQTSDNKKLEEMLKSSRISLDGFLGSDTRSLNEIISSDFAVLSELDISGKELAARMYAVTEEATAGLENWVGVGLSLEAMTIEVKGSIPCPWPHNHRCRKRLTVLRSMESGETVQWSDLNIHLIEGHMFFEGTGSFFRIDPRRLAVLLFRLKDKQKDTQ